MRFSFIISFLILFSLSSLQAQDFPFKNKQKPNRNRVEKEEKTPPSSPDDEIALEENDTSKAPVTQNVIDVKYADEPLEAQIDYSADDSMHFDVVNSKIYLWGNALVKYEEMELKAGHIIFDQKNNIVTAEGILDSLGKISSIPEFSDGSQQFKAKEMKYNFKTKKGLISHITTQENDLYIHSEKTLFQSFESSDSIYQNEDVIFSSNSIFTTCDHDEPHYGIRCKKQKLITDKLIVTGPANLEIAGVSTPLWLPFGFFPVTKNQKSGIISPKTLENNGIQGFGFRDIGYYWYINNKFDYQLTGDIYTRGTWRLNSMFRYNVKYRFDGSLNLQYAWNNQGDGVFSDSPLKNDIRKTFSVRWNMNQSQKAHPTRKFSARVEFQTNDAQRINNNDTQSVTSNSLSSNIDLNKSFPGKPYSLTANISHSQNTNTNDIRFYIPNVQFNVRRINPFKKKNRIGKEKWYEKIGINYKFEALGEINTKDSLLFRKETLDEFRYGFRHTSNIDAPLRFFKNFVFNPRISYNESWIFHTIDRDYVETVTDTLVWEVNPNNELDTIYTVRYDTTGQVVTNDIHGFKSLRQFNARADISTDVYSTLLFKKGRFKGIRWQMSPSIGFSYTPDYTQNNWGYFDNYVNGFDEETRYSVFEGNIFGQGVSSNGKQMNLTYGVRNIFEGKYLSRKDTINPIKRFKIFDNISVSGNYNFAADSLKFSPVRATGTARFFNNVTTMTVNATFDPYIEDETGRRLNTSRWETDKRLLRFDNLTTNINNAISLSHIKKWFNIGGNDKNEKERSKSNNPRSDTNTPQPGGQLNPSQGLGSFGTNSPVTHSEEFLSSLRIKHIFNFRIEPDTFIVVANNINIENTLNLSPKWHFSYGIGYDFKQKSINYPSVRLTRDLHCWQMNFTWYPERGAYLFTLGVKPSSLSFISVPWSRNQFEGGFGGL